MSFHPSVYPLCTAIADELHNMRQQLSDLAERLCLDEYFCSRHIESLQSFDALTQQAEESALMLERLSAGMRTQEALSLVRLGKMQMRLREHLDHLVHPESGE